MTSPYLESDIEAEEGRKYHAYADPLTHSAPWTIGIGHCGPEVHSDTIWTDDQINLAFASDVARAEKLLDTTYPWWRGLSDIRQDVLVQMTFQMGIGGLENFPHALAAMKAQNWKLAHDEMLDSDWARTETPERAKREANQMLTGVRSWA